MSVFILGYHPCPESYFFQYYYSHSRVFNTLVYCYTVFSFWIYLYHYVWGRFLVDSIQLVFFKCSNLLISAILGSFMFNVIIEMVRFRSLVLLLNLSQIWPLGTFLNWLLCSFTHLHHEGSWLLSGPTKCCRLVLHIPSPDLGTAISLENSSFGRWYLGTKISVITVLTLVSFIISRTSSWTYQENIYLYTNAHIHI